MQTCFVRLLRLYASSCLPRFARFSPAGGRKRGHAEEVVARTLSVTTFV
jgi:hypothetical protein